MVESSTSSRKTTWGAMALLGGLWVLAASGGVLGSKALAEDADFAAGFVSPVSNPVNFEDPRARSEVRAIYAYHKIASDFGRELDPGGIGGDAHIVAVQLRLAVTDRLALIATKDGYVWLRPKHVLSNEDGWANIAFGAKYNFYKDPKLGALASVGLRYEAPSGNTDVFQGQNAVDGKSRGEGILNPFFSAGWGTSDLGPGDLHVLTYVGMRWAIEGYDSSFFDWSLHADYGLDLGAFGTIFPLIETNLITTTDGGRRLPISQEGFDFFNFGSSGATDHTVMTIAYGFRYRLFEGLGNIMGKGLGADLGATYENTLTDRRDIFNWRVTTDLTFFLS
jgi:hypothetical protein